MFIASLFENYITEDSPRLVVLYPGRFQPFHLGHADVFRSLQGKFGRDQVFIATSNKTELPKSPFNFSDKLAFITAAGVPADRIIQSANPYRMPAEFDPTKIIFVVAVGEPDKDRLNPGGVKKDGNPGYFQKFVSIDQCEPGDKHGYVIIANERQKTIKLGDEVIDVSHGTEARAAWDNIRNDPKLRAQYLMQMYGRDDAELGRILDKIPHTMNEDIPPPENARKTQIAGTLGTYKKASDVFKQHGASGKALDFGAGLGKGTAELGKDAESYEPYPGPDFEPHYVDVSKIPDNSYERIVNLNVLNVVPNTSKHRIRDEIVRNIGRVLAPGGIAIITTRGKDVLTIKGTPGEEPMSMISSIGTYQKGFTSKELRDYVQNVLGNGFNVNTLKLGPAGVVVRKNENISEEAAGVGVVKNSKDPRYSMATMGDQNDVTGDTSDKAMRAYHLKERMISIQEQLNSIKAKYRRLR